MAVLAPGFQVLGFERLVKLRPDPRLALVGAEPAPGRRRAGEMLSQYPNDQTVKDAAAPFIMLPGKPNEHLMLPVHMEPI